jgi:hypothetical protein
MADIRYLSISDLHLGADTSLLTHLRPGTSVVEPTRPSAVLVQLAQCLETVSAVNQDGTRPILILNGDVLELALASDEEAVMAFERFVEQLFPANGPPLVDPHIIFIPGNHDHHLWEGARETQYAAFLQKKPPGVVLDPPWHVTKMYKPDPVDAVLLNGVIARYPHMKGVSVGTVYPNLCLFSKDETRCAIFTHGHFIESIYRLMSCLHAALFPGCQEPTRVWDLEKENFAWIDFFWSAMGRSGGVGADIGRIYEMLLVPQMRKKLAGQLARAAGRAVMPKVPWLGEKLGLVLVPAIRSFLGKAGGLEKGKSEQAFTQESSAGLHMYVEKLLCAQLTDERKGTPPVQATAIFGHTHKPFANVQDFAGLPEQVSVFNTGGWVVDTPATASTHGAAIAVIDDDLNVAALRIYNESDDPKSYKVRAESADGNPAANPLCVRLDGVLKGCPQRWEALSAAIASDVTQYHHNFENRQKRIEAGQ